MGLLSVLEPKTLYRNDLKLDLIKEVHLLAKEMMKQLSHVKAEHHLPVMVPRFLAYQVGIKAYYEMLAIEFVKHCDKFNLRDKARLMYGFALADIEPSFVIKTAHKICASYSEAFLQRGEVVEGLFSE